MEMEDREDGSPLVGWTKEEKFYLLQGLKSCGSNDIDRLQEYIANKEPDEITAAVNYYKQKAQKHPIFNPAPEAKKRGDRINLPTNNSQVPLSGWAKLLTESYTFKELQTETATALRLIAELESCPDPSLTNGIDFRAIYLELANAMDGKALVKDKLIASVLNKCLLETAVSSKSFIKSSALMLIVSSFNLVENKETTLFNRPTQNPELAILRHLITQKNYNPFNIPEEHLKPNYETVWKTDEKL